MFRLGSCRSLTVGLGAITRPAARAAARGMATTAKASRSTIYKIGGMTLVAGAAAVGVATMSIAECAADYDQARKDIANLLDKADHDDGSLGPLFVRLAWHASGTWDVNSKTGGSNGATMRYAPESSDGANAGLGLARDILEAVKRKHPEISYADLWTLAAVVAIEEMGGPKVGWRPGRKDYNDEKNVPPNGRLPDALQGPQHIRDVFYRMGFNDQEIVALVGAHCLGRCHADRSGFVGPWTYAPTTFSNDYFKELLGQKWTLKKWAGPKQYENARGDLMMLVGDMALVEDGEFKKWVDIYAKDQDRFFKDFAKAFQKLEEGGVPFAPERNNTAVAALIAGVGAAAAVAIGALAFSGKPAAAPAKAAAAPAAAKK